MDIIKCILFIVLIEGRSFFWVDIGSSSLSASKYYCLTIDSLSREHEDFRRTIIVEYRVCLFNTVHVLVGTGTLLFYLTFILEKRNLTIRFQGING